MEIATYKQCKRPGSGYDDPFITWLNRSLVMGMISHEDWDRESGKFFGYPNCCIKWFIFMSKMRVDEIGKMTDYLYGETHCGYVLCPKCAKKKLLCSEKGETDESLRNTI